MAVPGCRSLHHSRGALCGSRAHRPVLSAAPPQNPLPYPHTLMSQYAKTAHAAYPRHELRKLETPDFMVAAADKSDWNSHFP